MHPEMLKYYEKELQFVRGMGAEFAERYPGVAQRLDLGEFECADPYVERLLEGFAFLTARIQLKLDAEYPQFTQNLLDMVYPHYLAPTPSMTIVQFDPDLQGGVTDDGFTIPRGTRLRTAQTNVSNTRCDYRTSQNVDLWPIKILQAEYLRAGEANAIAHSSHQVKSAIRLQLETVQEIPFDTLALDSLDIYLDGGGETPSRIYEMLLAHCVSIIVRPVDSEKASPEWQIELPHDSVKSMGFEENEALLPYTDVSFRGYRYLQEYFAFPQRFLFVRFTGLQKALQRCKGQKLEIICLFDEKNELLEGALDIKNFALNCSPAINLFPKHGDRIHLSHRTARHHAVMDRTNPLDYEIYALTEVTGYDTSLQEQQDFRPFYACQSNDSTAGHHAYYTLHRRPRVTSINRQDQTDYVGTEVYLSLVDSKEAPYSAELKQLGIKALCTNRDLPLQITSQRGKAVFTMEDSAPVNQVHSLAGPTPPKPPNAEGENAWRLISHLSLNYLSLLDTDEEQGAAALRELLSLYGQISEPEIRKQIDGVLSVTSEPLVRRIPGAGPITFGRGVGITINCKENAFEGTGVFLLGTVLEKFFAKYVSLNSFTQTHLSTVERGKIKAWPVRTGMRAVL